MPPCAHIFGRDLDESTHADPVFSDWDHSPLAPLGPARPGSDRRAASHHGYRRLTSADPSPFPTGSDDSNCEKGTSGVMTFAVRSSQGLPLAARAGQRLRRGHPPATGPAPVANHCCPGASLPGRSLTAPAAPTGRQPRAGCSVRRSARRRRSSSARSISPRAIASSAAASSALSYNPSIALFARASASAARRRSISYELYLGGSAMRVLR